MKSIPVYPTENARSQKFSERRSDSENEELQERNNYFHKLIVEISNEEKMPEDWNNIIIYPSTKFSRFDKISEKTHEFQEYTLNKFIDFKQAYDTPTRDELLNAINCFGMISKLINIC